MNIAFDQSGQMHLYFILG